MNSNTSSFSSIKYDPSKQNIENQMSNVRREVNIFESLRNNNPNACAHPKGIVQGFNVSKVCGVDDNRICTDVESSLRGLDAKNFFSEGRLTDENVLTKLNGLTQQDVQLCNTNIVNYPVIPNNK